MLPGSGTYRMILSVEQRISKERHLVIKKVSTALAVFLCLALAATGSNADVKTLFPDMEGWEPEGDPEVYTAKTLPEYLDGHADLYVKTGLTKNGLIKLSCYK